MILQALTELYDDLLKRDEISRPGWGKVKVGFALSLDENGNVIQVIPQTEEVKRGDKFYTDNRAMLLPAPVKRSSGVAPNFLCDHSGYILGMDERGKPERTRECFEACAEIHKKLLGGIQNECATAIIRFFDNWNPQTADDNEAIAEYRDELIKGSNIVFYFNGLFAQEIHAIAEAWQDYYDQASGQPIDCLITGQKDVLAITHPAIKGVAGAQSSGASIVSFNATAFRSFGKDQGANAPVGKKAAFAYTTALNHLLSDKDNVQKIGDTTVVCWAKGAEPIYKSISLASLFGKEPPRGMDENEMRATVKRLSDGLPCEAHKLYPETEFYILGLSPNNARLSVRFFCKSRFGDLMKHVNDHHERMRIIGSRFEYMPLWALLRETVNMNTTDKAPNSELAGSVARSIFTGSQYPAGLLESTMSRIRAEKNISSGRAAIIKAYYLKNTNQKCPGEVLTVSLNENSTNIPYTLGRLFAVYEAAQERANPGINATIKDKYFNSAAVTPSHIMPLLNKLYKNHVRKMDKASQVFFEKQVGELFNILGESLPARLTLPEQASFQLGYYHQLQKRYEKKEN